MFTQKQGVKLAYCAVTTDDGDRLVFEIDEDDSGFVEMAKSSRLNISEKVTPSDISASIKALWAISKKCIDDLAEKPDAMKVTAAFKVDAEVGIVVAKTVATGSLGVEVSWSLNSDGH